MFKKNEGWPETSYHEKPFFIQCWQVQEGQNEKKRICCCQHAHLSSLMRAIGPSFHGCKFSRLRKNGDIKRKMSDGLRLLTLKTLLNAVLVGTRGAKRRLEGLLLPTRPLESSDEGYGTQFPRLQIQPVYEKWRYLRKMRDGLRLLNLKTLLNSVLVATRGAKLKKEDLLLPTRPLESSDAGYTPKM